MGRKARFTKDQFLEAALRLLADRGPSGVTMNAVAGLTGAPIGSVYQRFLSRDVLLAEIWLRVVESFQREFLLKLEQGDGLGAALHTPRWTRKHPKEGRVLLRYRREDLTRGDWPDDVKEQAIKVVQELNAGIRAFVQKKFGRITKRNLNRTVFALIDMPHAAVRRFLEAGEVPPAYVNELIRDVYNAVLKEES
jgi:AcrR family transcriptional regulator